ncbi:ArsR family transcriptional regulator [Deinococcus sp. Arct2-2]|uniref:ArsR/SmtB family transcription factor n=1 Tax=Deinococcus sp. Arct2-2 TaxID=2568653 RepID=UPI0010A45729|nr:helix-turn-helix domain-containing protein [Deinococcus sp. Arct2-2]THF71501.1 ArsR family transcriptional regulator [Deinococcus sp. Arct2-2]
MDGLFRKHRVVEGGDLKLVAHALNSDTRLQILSLLSHNVLNLTELTAALGLPHSTVSFHIKHLEAAGLLEVEYLPGTRGSQKLISKRYDQLEFRLPGAEVEAADDVVEVSMPIGNYTQISVQPTCGLSAEHKLIGMLDDPRAFFEPEHVFAQALWFGKAGHVEYTFPNNLPLGAAATEFELSMEVCSEAPKYNADWPSDLTLWVNETEVGTWTCPGDLGGVRAHLTPAWWDANQTTHGFLKRWRVTLEGAHIDGERLSGVTLEQLRLDQSNHIRIRLGVKPDARHQGGLNLFGRHFGNYPQDLLMRLRYAFGDAQKSG